MTIELLVNLFIPKIAISKYESNIPERIEKYIYTDKMCKFLVLYSPKLLKLIISKLEFDQEEDKKQFYLNNY